MDHSNAFGRDQNLIANASNDKFFEKVYGQQANTAKPSNQPPAAKDQTSGRKKLTTAKQTVPKDGFANWYKGGYGMFWETKKFASLENWKHVDFHNTHIFTKIQEKMLKAGRVTLSDNLVEVFG